MIMRIRGVVLPEREERTFWVDGERLRSEPPAGAAAKRVETVVDGGWLLPGLVDVHTHPGAESPDDRFDEALLRRHLSEHRDAGVLLVRTPGTAERMPGWVDTETELPRVRSAGQWLATPGRFFPGAGRDIGEDELAAAAVEEATAASGWCKVIGDWRWDEPAVPLDVLKATVDAVHAVGGRVAVHCQTSEGSHNVRLAHEAGVTVLAGTDTFPCGTVATESQWLLRAGMPAEEALGAASWTARAWLGLPGLIDGAPADLVAYDQDPVAEPAALGQPKRVILRGRIVR
ncbi:amidohydrolase family protein [Streptomyces scopuliridis]|uniref:amidohydrolase family protein n=1 Tax=Streptomyces scopuliridis TaxID=452529 RepID=UPI0036C91636